MRVLIASHNAAHVGGVETYIETIVPALARRGHAVGVWYEEGAAAGRAADPGIPRWFNASHSSSFGQLEQWRPDLVFTHGLRSPALEARVLAIAPAIAFAHSYLGTCVSGTKMHAFPSPVACTRVFGAACLAHYYPRRCGGWSPTTALEMYRRQSARLRLFERYRRILVASRHMADEYGRHGLAGKVRVVALPVPAITPPTGSPAPGGPRWRLLFLGRLEWTKGADIAVEAAAVAATGLDVPVHLVLAGSGSMDGALRRLADRLAASHPRITYTFEGAIAPDDRFSLLERTDLLLAPSRWPEPFGLVGNEAGSCGVPSVAFAAGGIPEWLTDGVNGRLVAGGPAVPPFARAIADVLADPATRTAMGAAARRVAERYSLDAHLRELDAVFLDALEAGAAAPR